MRRGTWFLAGMLGLALAEGGAGVLFLRTRAHGFSARDQPTAPEEFAARTARKLAIPSGAREERNPVPLSDQEVADAMAHWADHCAACHGNDGSGQVPVGQQMYPPAPDMRKAATQSLSDGELFYVIENGIRLSGMPAWGGSDRGREDSWKLVRFIRHLPVLTAQEIKGMERLNPKSPDDLEEERQEAEFLRGGTLAEPAAQHHHH